MGAGQPAAGPVADVAERGDSGRDAASGAKGGAARPADDGCSRDAISARAAVSARDAGCADDAGCAHGAGGARDTSCARDTGDRGDIVTAVVRAPAGSGGGGGDARGGDRQRPRAHQ